MKPTTAHLMTRAEWRYRVVSETCCTNLGSVADRFSSISRRIRCSSSESGISPISDQGSSCCAPIAPVEYCPSILAHGSPPLNARGAPDLPGEARRAFRARRHRDRSGPAPRRPTVPAPPADPAPGPDRRPRRPPTGLGPVAEQLSLVFGGRLPSRTSCWPDDAEQADAPADVEGGQELAGDPAEVGGEVGRLGERARPGDGAEVAEAHLELHGARGHPGGAQPRRHAVGQAHDAVLERGVVVQVDREGLLVPDRLHHLLGHDRRARRGSTPARAGGDPTRCRASARACLRGARRARRRSAPRARRACARSRARRPRAAGPGAGGGTRARCPVRRRGGRRAWRGRWPAWPAASWWRPRPRR